MRIKELIISFFVLVSITLNAQDWSTDVYSYGEQYPGYIIDENGNKTEGFIKYRDRYSMQNEVIFFTEKGNKKTKVKYKTSDLTEYKVADKLYHCINYSGGLMAKPIRANLLVNDGCIKEYVWYDKAEDFSILRKMPEESVEEYEKRLYPPTSVFYKDGDDKPVTVSYFGIKFVKKMTDYISDNEDLAKKVFQKEKGYKMLNILDIFAEYNENCTTE